MDRIIEILARELGKDPRHVENVVRLLDEGSTVPFIARYRKELHGAMDDTALRTLEERLSYLRGLAERREAVKKAIEAQGKLTEELSAAIDAAGTLAEVEDLYRPYKQKRRTRATIARERGLTPLAEVLFAQGADCPVPEEEAAKYLDPEKGVETVEDALAGASDIIAETVSDDAALRGKLRALLGRSGYLTSSAVSEEDSVYRLYYDFRQPLSRVQGYQVLAINRGEKEGFLKVSIDLDREAALPVVRRHVLIPGSRSMAFVRAAAEDAYDRLLFPSLEREARGQLSDDAYEGAIGQFALNLRPLLMQPPVKGKVTMGLDPGYRMGCKVAVVDGTGKVLDTAVVYPTYGERQRKEAIAALAKLIRKDSVEHIAIGNGTASRETEAMAVELIHQVNAEGRQVSYMIVSEAGASVYSASPLAAAEFPAVRREPAQRRLHRPAAAGPSGRAGEDRPQGHRRGAVSARLPGEAPGRGPLRRGGGLRQRRGGGREHGVPQPAAAGLGAQRHDLQEYRCLPGGKRPLHLPGAIEEGPQAGAQGL